MKRARMTVEEIERELEALEPLRARVKAHAMRYQASLKDQVAADLGVSSESLDLPYVEWAAIRDKWLEEQGKR